MCKLVPVLRVVGFVFLVLAFLAATIGFLVPFWVRLPLDHGLMSSDAADVESAPTDAAAAAGGDQPGPSPSTPPGSAHQPPSTEKSASTAATMTGPPSGASMSGSEVLRQLLIDGIYEGLWAKCHSNNNNWTCSCFWQNEFQMEKDFPVWHQAAQGLFGIGLLLLLVALVTASFHVCCCHCCQESFAIATVVGSLVAAGLLLITFSLAVFGIFSTVKNDVQLTGGAAIFHWGFFVSIGAVGVALLAAILFIVDGHRGPSDVDGDGEETAKMV